MLIMSVNASSTLGDANPERRRREDLSAEDTERSGLLVPQKILVLNPKYCILVDSVDFDVKFSFVKFAK